MNAEAEVTSVTLEYEEALRLLRRAVMEKGGDYVFKPERVGPSNYWYFNPETGAPGCIVGHVLSYRGITLDTLEDQAVNRGMGFAYLLDLGIVECDERTAVLLDYAQGEQDHDRCWREAVDNAELEADLAVGRPNAS